MKKFLLSIAAAATLASGLFVATTSTASADPFRGGYYRGGGYYGGGYGRGYRSHRYRHGGGDALAAGAIGLGVGALLGSAIASRPYSDDRFYGEGYYGNGYYGGGYYGRPGVVLEGPVVRERRTYRAARAYDDYRPARRIRSSGYSHAEACAARYRTYDVETDTYIARPGVVRRCRL